MDYNKRIGDDFLRGDHLDGEVLQHTELNELENVAKTAINANYEDIQKLQNGVITVGNSEMIDGASLSKYSEETLQNSDTTVPTSMQTKQYVDAAISNIGLDGYYTKSEIDGIVEIYDSDGNGIVDNAEKVNNHTVAKDVPADAKFTDTVYDDTNIQNSINTLNTNKQDKLVSGTNIKTINSTTLLGNGNVSVQPTLVSGTNIKTINNQTLLGSGNVAVQPTLVSGTNIKTINNQTLLGSGNINIQGGGDATDVQINGVSITSDGVANINYASYDTGGVIKSGWYNLAMDSAGHPYATTRTYEQYTSDGNSVFISKGTLENVLNARIGLIDDYLDEINGEVI